MWNFEEKLFEIYINNLIYASTSIGEGNFNAKVPEVKTDKDLEILNKNFKIMFVNDRLVHVKSTHMCHRRLFMN